jgi:hypothetical protein
LADGGVVLRNMASTLHPHLKRGLDFDDFYVDPKDVFEEDPAEHLGPVEQAAKRRRIEKIASQILRGRRPMILSAGLRGPFGDGWKNPWAKNNPTKKRMSHRPSEASASGRSSTLTRGTGGAKKHTRSEARKVLETQQVASPEASRAADDDLEPEDHTYTLEEFEVPLATAPLPDEHDTSGATEFFSVETGECIQSRSPLTDPFWLRRPNSGRTSNQRRTTSASTPVSPTHSRSGSAPLTANGKLQLSFPKAPLGAQVSLTRIALPMRTTSSASASMVFSSPAKPCMPTTPGNVPLSTTKTAIPRTTIGNVPTVSSSLHPAQPQSAASVPMITPAATERAPGQPLSGNERQRVHSRASTQAAIRRPQQELVASTASTPATGFVYKKKGSTTWNIANAPRSKPKPVNFNSSPAIKNNDKKSSQRSPPSVVTTVVAVTPRETAKDIPSETSPHERVPSTLTTEMGDKPSQNRDEEQQSSVQSTQAAMMQAYLGYAESPWTNSSATPRQLWAQTLDDTARPSVSELSPAVTPISVFKAQIGPSRSLRNLLREPQTKPQMNTQEMFANAPSPSSSIMFSTIKKRIDVPQRSNLRLAMRPFDDEATPDVTTPKSPTPSADRILLIEKNTMCTSWSFTMEKEMFAPQSIGSVGPPLFDHSKSTDGCGPNESLGFTKWFPQSNEGG